MGNLDSLVDFFVNKSNKLKTTIRYGSCPESIQESTADHSWHLTIMVPIIARRLELEIDIPHAIYIALVHDIPEYKLKKDYEAYLVSKGILSKRDKDESEEATMCDLKEDFSFGYDELYCPWKEYQENKTKEARYVKALDKCESNIHIIERGGIIPNNNPEHQIFYADEAVKNFPQLKPFLRAIKKKMRPLMEAQGFEWKPEYNYPD